MARIVGTTGTTAPPRRSHKQSRRQPAPYVLSGPHDVGVTARPKSTADSFANAVNQPRPGFTGAQRQRVLQNADLHARRHLARVELGRQAKQLQRTAPPLLNLGNVQSVKQTRGLYVAGGVSHIKGVSHVELLADQLRHPRPGLEVTFKPGTPERAITNAADQIASKRFQGQVAGSNPSVLGKFGDRALANAISLPRNVVLSTYLTGRAAVKAAEGHPQELKALGQQIKQHDPFALLAQGKFGKALHEGLQNPLNTALEGRGLFYGGGNLAGRLAGLSTKREAAVLPSTAMEQARTYSQHPLVQALERRREARQAARYDQHTARGRALEAQGHEDAALAEFQKAGRPPSMVTDKQIQHRADVSESMGQPARRRGRTQVAQDYKGQKVLLKPSRSRPGMLVPVQEGGHLQGEIARGIVPARILPNGRVDVGDLRARLVDRANRLEAEQSNLSGWRLNRNRKTVTQIRKALKVPDAQLERIAEDAHRSARYTNALEAEALGRGMRNVDEAQTARFKDYAVHNMGAFLGRTSEEDRAWQAKWQAQREQAAREGRPPGPPPPKPRKHLVVKGHDGETVGLNYHDVTADMQHKGFNPENVSFVTQAPRGLRGAFNTRYFPRKALGTDRTKTGEATRLGLYDTHPRALHENAGRLQQAIAADENFRHAVSQVALRDGNGKVAPFATRQAAEEAIHNAQFTKNGERIPGAPDMRVIRLVPFGTEKARQGLNYLMDHGDEEGFVVRGGVTHHPISEAIKSAVDENAANGPGPYGVVPAVWAKRIEDHADVYKSSSPTLRALTSMFRHTVLPLSMPWLFGNVSEAAMRAIVQDPRILKNIRLFRAVHGALERIDPPEAAHLQDIIGTGHFGMSEVSNTHVSLEQFAGRKVEPVVRALTELRARPGVGTLMDAYRAYTHWVFESVNSRLEIPFKEAMAGHHLRTVLGKELEDTSAQALADALRGEKGTNAQVRLADSVRRAYGQYEAFSPGERKFIVLYSPFMAWSVNAMRFLGQVLPKDHPALTGAIAAMDSATQQWRKDNGLEEGEKGAVPAFLMGSIPLPGGGHLRVARYTPFGFFSDPSGSLAGMILPQYSGVFAGLQGQKWTGQPLKGPAGGEPTQQQKIGYAGLQFLESHVPFISVIQGIGSKGGSVTKPQSIPKALVGYENPLKVTGGKGGATGSAKFPKGYDPNKVDWGSVKWGSGGGGGVDWSKVNWGAAK